MNTSYTPYLVWFVLGALAVAGGYEYFGITDVVTFF